MAHAKRYLFEAREQLFADYNRALSHPARWRIITLLQRRGHCSFAGIMNQVPLSRSTVQIHLRVLKSMQLIKVAENDLREAGYVLNNHAFDEARSLAMVFWQG